MLISDVNLAGPGPTVWDPNNNTYACIDDGNYYVPVRDGSYNSVGDAFDDALSLRIGSGTFNDADGNGDLTGQTLKVGPEMVSGLKVSQTTTALPFSPTLRDLIMLRNPSSHAVTRILRFDTNLGSDDETKIPASSSGDATFTAGDRWVITTQGSTPPFGDPIVTQVYYGKKAT